MTHPITTAAEMRKRCAQIARNHESTYHNAANVCRFIVDQIEALPVAEPQTVDTTKPSWPDAANFHFGQLVEKPRGAHWSGHVCGWYSTPATRIGYNVLSDRHENSVQIYPETALVPIGERHDQSDRDHRTDTRDCADRNRG